LRTIDPEGDVTDFEYYPSDDPDGDGTPVATPVATDAGGYLHSRIVDTVTGADDDTPATRLQSVLSYDAVGNVIVRRDPRGVVTRIEVNALNEPVLITRGADVSEAVATGQLLTGEEAFAYQTRRFYDHNGRVVKTETKNRSDVSTTDGVGDFVERTITYDLLNNELERALEVDASTMLVWQQRYDGEELLTTLTEPEGNVLQVRYDGRDLPFQITRGHGSPQPSTVQIDYDGNGNRSRHVDAEDNDGDGQPEVTILGYDGFDRLTSATDALGNETITTHDNASNVVRTQMFGHPPQMPGATTGGGSNVLLADLLLSRDELNRTFQIDTALFISEGFLPRRPIALEDQNDDGFVTSLLEFDRDSRLRFVVEDDLEAAERKYDGADRVVETVDALGNRVTTSYDQNSNPTVVRSFELSPDALVAEEAFTTTYVYDQLDRLVRATDNAGQTTRFHYDSRDNLVARSDPHSALTNDPLGLFLGQINTAGNTKT
jgi:YD repeat-containing protein